MVVIGKADEIEDGDRIQMPRCQIPRPKPSLIRQLRLVLCNIYILHFYIFVLRLYQPGNYIQIRPLLQTLNMLLPVPPCNSSVLITVPSANTPPAHRLCPAPDNAVLTMFAESTQTHVMKGDLLDLDFSMDMDHRKRRRNRTTQSCLNCHTSKRKVTLSFPPSSSPHTRARTSISQPCVCVCVCAGCYQAAYTVY